MLANNYRIDKRKVYRTVSRTIFLDKEEGFPNSSWSKNQFEDPERLFGLGSSPCKWQIKGSKRKENAMKEKMPIDFEKAMVISPHPDDIDFGCSGTVARWSREGKKILYVICTSGDKGTDDPQMNLEVLANIREKEQRAAAHEVGVREVIFLRLKDGELEDNRELRGLLVKVIRIHRPEVVLSIDPSNFLFDNPYVNHRDHRVTALAVFDAIYPAARNPNFFPEHLEEGLSTHSVDAILFFATNRPNIWIDITDTIESKITSLQCHKSQIADLESVGTWLRKRSSEVGKERNLAFAESFRYLEFPR